MTAAGGDILVVPNFTLYASIARGRRPDFAAALGAEQAQPLFERFVVLLRARLPGTETGRFGADMQVKSVNDGPVTLMADTVA